jgi:hypothetical protein
MTKLTIYDVSKILGLDQKFCDELKNKYESYEEDKKMFISKTLWDGFWELYKKLSEVKYNQFLQEAEDGKRKLTTNIMNEAKSAVWKDFYEILAGKPQEKNEMEEIRNKLKFLTENAKKT